MVNWPITTGLIGIATIFSFLAMITICGIYRAVNDDDDDDRTSSGYDQFEPSEVDSTDIAQSETVSSVSDNNQFVAPDSTFNE